MANLKSNDYRNIPLEKVEFEFSKTKAYPSDLLMPEVQDAWVYAFENGTAELSFKVRTDMEPTTGAMNTPFEGAPGFFVETEIDKQQLLDCITYSNVYDVSGGGVVIEGEERNFIAQLDEDFVRQKLNDQAPAIVRSYICLFGAGAIAQARAEHEANKEPKGFKSEMEAIFQTAALAA